MARGTIQKERKHLLDIHENDNDTLSKLQYSAPIIVALIQRNINCCCQSIISLPFSWLAACLATLMLAKIQGPGVQSLR